MNIVMQELMVNTEEAIVVTQEEMIFEETLVCEGSNGKYERCRRD